MGRLLGCRFEYTSRARARAQGSVKANDPVAALRLHRGVSPHGDLDELLAARRPILHRRRRSASWQVPRPERRARLDVEGAQGGSPRRRDEHEAARGGEGATKARRPQWHASGTVDSSAIVPSGTSQRMSPLVETTSTRSARHGPDRATPAKSRQPNVTLDRTRERPLAAQLSRSRARHRCGRHEPKSLNLFEVASIQRHERHVVAQAACGDPCVVGRNRLALDLALRADATPDPADLTRVRKDHDVPKPCLELLNPSLAPPSLERALEELADRDEGDAHDLAADVFVQGGRKGSSLKM